jgi:hypothetical protein
MKFAENDILKAFYCKIEVEISNIHVDISLPKLKYLLSKTGSEKE